MTAAAIASAGGAALASAPAPAADLGGVPLLVDSCALSFCAGTVDTAAASAGGTASPARPAGPPAAPPTVCSGSESTPVEPGDGAGTTGEARFDSGGESNASLEMMSLCEALLALARHSPSPFAPEWVGFLAAAAAAGPTVALDGSVLARSCAACRAAGLAAAARGFGVSRRAVS